MESIKSEVVVPKGISVIFNVFLSTISTFARTRIRPPLFPSLYSRTSTKPPVRKSGYNSNDSFRKYFMDASISSQKLCDITLVDKPTAIPSAPCASNNGNLTGNCSGSRFLPSYDNCHFVISSLNTTSSANLDNRASI